MKFAVISHTEHIKAQDQLFAYAPYVKEMNIWLKYVDEVQIVAPLVNKKVDSIKIPYQHKSIAIKSISAISLVGFFEIVKSVWHIPGIIFQIYKTMRWADHIHLRCPGNIGLLGCFTQILFPKKPKTVKYAGNWDPKAKQPWSYMLQKWILSNTFLSRNLQVLVYGEWKNQSKNIHPFFTASFTDMDAQIPVNKDFSEPIKFLFVGTLSKGKRPILAVQIVEDLKKMGFDVSLDIYGEGILKSEIENYIAQHKLQDFIQLKGAKSLEELKLVYQQSHFLILPSRSEGWPKVVAEAMFWGTIPVATDISCVAWMLGNTERGILIEPDRTCAVTRISEAIKNKEALKHKAEKAQEWSRNYTTDFFEMEIAKLLKSGT